MTGAFRPGGLLRSVRALLLALLPAMLLVVGSGPAYAQPAAEGGKPIMFDLSAQPLREALARFDATANLSVMFPSDLAEGRTSSPVRGLRSAPEALQELLSGTGLVARSVAPGAYVLAPDAGAPTVDAPRVRPDAATPGQMQARLHQALCRAPDVKLGHYRLALSVQFTPDGHVKAARLLDTTGSAARDAAVIAAVRGVRLDAPPADPSRPFVVLVRAREPGAAPACPGESGEAGGTP